MTRWPEKPPSEDWAASIEDLAQQFRGRRFGELILYHVKRFSLPEVVEASMETASLLPEQLQGLTEKWIDLNKDYGLNEEFWRSDCGDVCLSIVQRAKQFSSTAGTKADSNTLLNLFQLVVLNFAYGAHREPRLKSFIQKAIGIGFLRRFFSHRDPR